MVAILTVGLWAGTGALPAHAAGPHRGASHGPNKNEAEGRKHARKANQLADVNKCKAAIPEYTKAIRLLKDPTLLFNRAECYRRTGEAQKAIADYRKFLVQLPAAPNRGQVENQIAALEKKPARAVVAVTPAAPVASPPIPRVATPRPPAEPPPPPPPEASPVPAPAPVAEERKPAEPEVPERELAAPSLGPSLASPPPAPAPAETPAPMALVDTKKTPSADTGAQSGSSYWWVWVVGAVVLAGAGAGTYFALKQGGTDIPPSMLGNYKF